MTHISLRVSTPQDLPTLRAWDKQPHVKNAIGDDDTWEWTAADLAAQPWRDCLIAEADGVAFGFLQIMDPALEESHYWGAVEADQRAIDLWIGPPDYLGKGYGTTVMRLGLERCFADSAVTGVLIDPLASNTSAHRFYRRFGFQFIEERIFVRESCHVFRLSREDWLLATTN